MNARMTDPAMGAALSRRPSKTVLANVSRPPDRDRYGDPLQLLAAKASAGVWNWDLETGGMTWSPAISHLLDIEDARTEVSFSEFRLKIHPDDRPDIGELETLLTKGIPVERNFRLVTHDGRLRWIEFKCELVLEAGCESGSVVGVVIDVTARQEVLQLLKNVVEKFGAFRSALSDAVVMVRPNGNLIDSFEANSVLGKLGFAQCKKSWIDIVHSDDRPSVRQQWHDAITERSSFVARFRALMPSGEALWVIVRGAPVQNPAGLVYEWALVVAEADNAILTSGCNDVPLTGAQIRAGRGILNWSVRDLGTAADVSTATIRRIEEMDGSPWRGHADCKKIRQAMERGGVEFIFPPHGKPGVRPC